MPKPHTVRLRGPWHTNCGRRVQLPTTWADALGDADSVRLSRSFNRPPRLDLAGVESFALRTQSPHRVERILVNGSVVGDGSNLLGVLADTNRVVVELTRVDPAATILEATLEITERQ